MNKSGLENNMKRFIVAVIAVWIVNIIIRYVLNMVILDWSIAAGSRGEEQMTAWVFIMSFIGRLVFAFMFCFIFIKGYEGKGILEGLRFGFYIGILVCLPNLIDYSAFFTWPAKLAMGAPIGEFIITVILGVVVSLVYKPKAAEA